MISVILYGRNDSHGYNLHKRAAISLNCIAEVLSDADDEIIFVDYNTPNDLPTFIEAIYDTLTPLAKSCLRVFRVRPQLHARMVPRTHLFALEPHSRNIAIRRSNPRNRWILSTNTDMIFLPCPGIASMAEAVRDIPDGQYILPRYELPEALWESFPRSDPQAIMNACSELGRKLHLDETVFAFPYMRFQSPGDFQLVPRQAMFDINGFDERMIHGWHADSNMCKRFYIYFGATESLAHRLKGYHCDHTRVATLAHRLDIKLENDLYEFVYDVTDPVAHHQSSTWGVPDEPVEELDFTGGPAARFVPALERALGSPQPDEYYCDAHDQRNFVYYQPEHVLPYLAGNLTVFGRDARFAYAGNNPRMLELTARCVAEMGFTQPVYYVPTLLTAGPAPAGTVPVNNGSLYDHLLADYDTLIFDFGLDRSGLDQSGMNSRVIRRVTDWPRDLRYSLGAIARCLERCAQQSDSLWQLRGHIPDFIVLNANHYIFRNFVGQFLLATDTPPGTHVRKGRPRVGEERLYRSYAWRDTEDRMRSFFGYEAEEYPLPVAAPGLDVDFTSAANSAHFKDGNWGEMDFTGSWTEGPCPVICFAPPPSLADDLVVFVRINEVFLGPDGDPIRVQVFFEGELLSRWTLYIRFEFTVCKVVLPRRLMLGKDLCRLEFHVENPQPAELVAKARGQVIIGEDPRELGFKVQRITFAGTERLRYSSGQVLDFTEQGQGGDHANECWTNPDNLGSWTLGPDANFTLLLNEPIEAAVTAIFTITDVAVSDHYPGLEVAVAVDGHAVANWILGPTRDTDRRKVLLPAGMLNTRQPVCVSFHINDPRTPARLHWSSDTRPLGFRLTRFQTALAGPSTYKLGSLIDFTDGGNSILFVEDYLGEQWALPGKLGLLDRGVRFHDEDSI